MFLAVLDTNDVVHALDRKKRCRVIRLVEGKPINLQPSRFVEKTNREVETFRLSRV